MRLFRAFAFVVVPQRGVDSPSAPRGGRIALRPPIRGVLDKAFDDTRSRQGTDIQLRVRTDGTRSSEVRDSLISLGFAGDDAALTAARKLALRLSAAMDERSGSGLLVATAARENAQAADRRIALWVFPSDQFLQLRVAADLSDIDIVTNAFSRNSSQRKLATFEGRNIAQHFLTGRALDFQARSGVRDVAEYWLDLFLDATHAIADQQGTRLLADILHEAARSDLDLDDKERLTAAVIGLRASQRTRWSIDDVGREFLDGGAGEAFQEAAKKVIPDVGSRTTVFDLSREEFDRRIGQLLYRLENGVSVLVPLGESNAVVVQDSDGARQLRVEGVIRDEKLRKGNV